MDTGEYGVGGFEIWRLWVPPYTVFHGSKGTSIPVILLSITFKRWEK